MLLIYLVIILISMNEIRFTRSLIPAVPEITDVLYVITKCQFQQCF